VKSLFGEHLEGAMGDFSVILGVVLGGVALGLKGLDDLDMAFWSKGARINQWSPSSHTLLVYIESRCHIVQSVANN
jgi:hypothetical protein